MNNIKLGVKLIGGFILISLISSLIGSHAVGSTQNIVIGCIIAAAIAIAIGISLTLSIVNPLAKGVAMMQDMVKGHLGTRLKMNRKDEIGTLADSMDEFSEDLQKNVVAAIAKIGEGDLSVELAAKDRQDEIAPAIMKTLESLRALMADMATMSKQHDLGDIDVVMDGTRFSGAYREMAEGVNKMVNGHIAVKKKAMACIAEFGSGNLDAPLEKFPGKKAFINDNIERLRTNLKEFIQQMKHMSEQHTAGDIDVNIPSDKFEGSFKVMAQGVNDMVNGHIAVKKKAMACIAEFGRGNFEAPLEKFPGKKAFINDTIEVMRKNLKALIADANLLSKAAVEGKLATRADASRHEGDFRKIVQGVNVCLDAVIGPLNVAAKYVDDISKGVIPSTITDTYNGDFNTIKNNLNVVVKMMSDLLEETDIIIKAAADGELDKRANADLFAGGWKQLVSGVNDTITNIVNPLMVTADYVEKVSNGVIPPEITDVYKGQYNLIKNNLNAVVKMMSSLLRETNILVQAAIGGQLGTRANAGLFVGGWNELVAGVNKTLDSVLEPINEAAAILEKVAGRDLTARVKGDYKGDHAKIKQALNSAVDNLDQALTQAAESAEQVAGASTQISEGSQSLAQGANEQASSLEEVSSSLEEMSSMTKQNAENANQAKTLAAEANGNAAQGAEAMGNMSIAINKIKESSDQTAKIVKTIDEIAMQTNLLALNAAVEAARAGEAGRGFAVVAEEVRNLAQRSAQAAKNTADMISESVKNAEDGVKISGEVSKSFESIAVSSKKVNDLINEIAAASSEQSTGIDQLNTAVAQMDKVTQQNAANSEESAGASEEMSSQAEELQSMIAQFSLTASAGKREKAPRPVHAAKSVLHDEGHGYSVKAKPAHAATVRSGKSGNGKINAEDIIPMKSEVLREF